LISQWAHLCQKLVLRKKRAKHENHQIVKNVEAVLAKAKAAIAHTAIAKSKTKVTHFKFNICRN